MIQNKTFLKGFLQVTRTVDLPKQVPVRYDDVTE
jgi:hypothetical protein